MSRRCSFVLFATIVVVIAITATLTLTGCGGGGSTNTTPPPANPSISISLAHSTVNAGENTTFTLTMQNTTASPSCSVPTGQGVVAVNGSSGTYTAPPLPNPSQLLVTMTCSASAATTTAAITIPAATIAITAPSNGATVHDAFSVTASTSGLTVLGYQFKVDGTGFGSETTNPSASITIPANGPHTLSVAARTAAGTITSPVVNVTVVNSVAPTLSLSCPQSTINANATMDCTLTVGGTPTPVVTASAVHGTVTVNGAALHYTAPAAANSDTITVTASNGVGSPAVATWNLQVTVDLKPTFTGASQASVYGSYISFAMVEAQGSNFAVGDQITATPQPSQFQLSYVSPTKMDIYFAIDRMYWDPGRFDVVDTNSYGTSNALHLAHRSGANMITCSATECFLLDPANYSTVYTFNRSTGQKVRENALTAGCITPCIGLQGIAYDDVTKVYLAYVSRMLYLYKADNSAPLGAAIGREVFITNATAGYGFACLADQEFSGPNNLIYFSLATSPDHPFIEASDVKFVPVALGDQTTAPGTVSITKVDSQVVCNVYDIRQNQLVSVNIPQGTVRYQITVAGLSPDISAGTSGGWWNLALPNGNNVLVSSFEKVAVIYDPNGSEIKRVNLSGTPVLATLDNSGNVIVAEYDNPITGIVKFEKVNPTTGNVSMSPTTVTDFFPTGMYGTSVGNRSTYKELSY